ncbi:YicC/YloC family endoribonuclease [uncultured Agitococcus sp.]|uniref:YicC/YloC family endoribonuclease n=1 Tax=uncultured Agitococcus sp. TaxID=1506599 RepID=UPI0026116651|nr:YicC/YloC family endoribonuclease [uncultured Agitococcus sp.]
MTAFARRELRGDFGLLVCEIRSVNQRYLEANFRLSDVVRELEMPLRDKLRQQLSRGKVDVWIKHEAIEGNVSNIHINQDLAARLVAAASQIDQLARHAAPLNAADILRIPGVVCVAEPNQQALLAATQSLFDQTLSDFVAMRQREGQALQQFIGQRLDLIAVECEKVRERMPHILAHYRQRLLARLQDIKAELDNDRLEQEMVLFAHKIDVAEELDRLSAHLVEIKRVLQQGGAVGRKLDFLMQELNREANTLGSKSVSADSSLSSVELKVLIEQMREQIQNLE